MWGEIRNLKIILLETVVILSLNSMKIVLDFRVLKMQSVESSQCCFSLKIFFKIL